MGDPPARVEKLLLRTAAQAAAREEILALRLLEGVYVVPLGTTRATVRSPAII
jgi:hypothetical protein